MDRALRITYIVCMSTAKPEQKVTLKQLGGFRGLFMRPGLILFTLRRGAYIGADTIGNQYFEQRATLNGTRPRRWAIYASRGTDASVVGPEWHAWLHYLTDAPLPDSGAKPWQKPHQPNLTGTPASYRPAGHDYQGGNRARASADYESWSPDL
jgi:NADH:ubiquinone oxidoreductase subunit